LPFAGEATVGNGVMFSMAAPSREMVDAIFAKVIELGGTSEGAPGLRGPEEYGYYACYFRDLDGNKLMVNHQQKP
jgi:predicted lactoylglutathione lyase